MSSLCTTQEEEKAALGRSLNEMLLGQTGLVLMELALPNSRQNRRESEKSQGIRSMIWQWEADGRQWECNGYFGILWVSGRFFLVVQRSYKYIILSSYIYIYDKRIWSNSAIKSCHPILPRTFTKGEVIFQQGEKGSVPLVPLWTCGY